MILAPEVLTPEKLHTHLKSLETFGVPPWNSIGQDHNIDLLIRSNSKKVLKACNKLPEPKKGVMELAALAAIATNQMIGASEDQQNFLETCLKGCTNLFIRIAGDILQSVILNLTAQGSHNDADLLVSAVLGNGTAHLRNFPELLMAILTISGPERSPKLIEILERELRPDASFLGGSTICDGNRSGGG